MWRKTKLKGMKKYKMTDKVISCLLDAKSVSALRFRFILSSNKFSSSSRTRVFATTKSPLTYKSFSRSSTTNSCAARKEGQLEQRSNMIYSPRIGVANRYGWNVLFAQPACSSVTNDSV